MVGKETNWAKVAIAASVFSMLPVYGLYQCDRYLATNRAWMSPCLFGLLLACSGLVPFVWILLTRGDFKAVIQMLFSFIIVGLSPTLTTMVLTAPRWIHCLK